MVIQISFAIHGFLLRFGGGINFPIKMAGKNQQGRQKSKGQAKIKRAGKNQKGRQKRKCRQKSKVQAKMKMAGKNENGRQK